MELSKVNKLRNILNNYHVNTLEEYNLNWYIEDIFEELIECALNRKADVVIEEISDGKYNVHVFIDENTVKTIYVKASDTKNEIIKKIISLM
ncbi:MAG: hypothetical protein N2Z71_00800 [Caloramator sp.]|nr:hypothetical protein [Caloramator sp.]